MNAKLLLCIAMHLYHGPIEPSTKVDVLSETCAMVSLNTVRKRIAKCASEGAGVCEAISSADGKKLTLEYKIQVSK